MQKQRYAAVALVALVWGCSAKEKSGAAGSACATDADCKNGFLCESLVCVPADLARRVRAASAAGAVATVPALPAAATLTAAPLPEPAPSAPPVVDEGPIPLIPTELSDPPQGNDWKLGKDVNTQNVHSQADNCEMRVLREWLQVTCRNDYTGYEKMENFGKKLYDYYERIDPKNVVSFVLRLKKGKTQQVRICAPKKRASLFVNWPAADDRPKHIALGKGPPCEETPASAFKKKKPAR